MRDIYNKGYIIEIISVIVLITFILSGLYQVSSYNTAFNNSNKLSINRIMQDIKEISKEPRPMGSKGHKKGQGYILREIKSMGYTPRVQTTISVHRFMERFVKAGEIDNIMVRIPGLDNSKAVLIAGHYDSVPWSFGANDDGSAVAVMLEVMRVLKEGKALKNDLIFLFSDGEEEGLLGSRAFITEHPWAKNIGLVLNLEARGDSGRPIMFETSQVNQWMIKGIKNALNSPRIYSFLTNILSIMPFGSDFAIFKEAGIPGFNFAYFKGADVYHCQLDNAENVSPDSIRGHGYNTLNLINHFASMDLNSMSGQEDMVFFNIFNLFVSYSGNIVLPLTIVILIFFIVLIVLTFKEKKLTIKGLISGILFFLLGIIVLTIFSCVIIVIFKSLSGEKLSTVFRNPDYSKYYIFSFTFFIIWILTLIYEYLLKRLNAFNIMFASLILWVIFALVSLLYLPSANYIFIYPIFINTISILYLLKRKRENKNVYLIINSVILGISINFLLPLFYLIYIFMGFYAIQVFAFLLVLVFGLSTLYLSLLNYKSRKVITYITFIISILLLIIGCFNVDSIKKHPDYNYISYGFDADSGRALWITDSKKIDRWESKFFTQHLKELNLKNFYLKGDYEKNLYSNQAPVIEFNSPVSTLIKDMEDKGMRELSLLIKSSRSAPLMKVIIESKRPLVDAKINKKGLKDNFLQGDKNILFSKMEIVEEFIFFNLPTEGIELDLTLKSEQDIKLHLIDCTYGLPVEVSGQQRKNSIPKDESDFTMVSRSFEY